MSELQHRLLPGMVDNVTLLSIAAEMLVVLIVVIAVIMRVRKGYDGRQRETAMTTLSSYLHPNILHTDRR